MNSNPIELNIDFFKQKMAVVVSGSEGPQGGRKMGVKEKKKGEIFFFFSLSLSFFLSPPLLAVKLQSSTAKSIHSFTAPVRSNKSQLTPLSLSLTLRYMRKKKSK